MVELDPKSKTFAIPATLIGLVLLVGAAFTFTQSTFVESSKQEEITFYHVTDGAYSYDQLQDTFDQSYAGVHGDTARVGDYRFVLDPQESNAAYGKYDTDSCFAVPRVERNGQVVDDYSLNGNPIVDYSSWVDKEDSENNEADYGDLKAVFAQPLYKESSVWRGSYFGMDACYGPLNRYSIQVPFDGLSMTAEAPENVTEGEQVVVDVRFENGWKPLEADLTGEACISGYCSEFSRSNVSIPVGGRTVSVEAAEPVANFTGEVSVDVGGQLGLDMQEFETENVVTDCDGDGENEDASRCSTVQIAELDGGQLVNVVPAPEEPPSDSGFLDGFLQPLIRFLSFG